MRDLAREFAAQGHEPVVLVPDEGLQRAWALDTLNGIQVRRLQALPTRDISYLWRTVTEFVLPWVMLRGLRKGPFRAMRSDAVVWYSPSIFFGRLVSARKRSSKCRSHLILRDIFPEWAVDLSLLKRGFAYRVFKKIERQQHDAAAIIGIQTPSNREYLVHLADKPGVRMEVLWNWLAAAPNTGCSIDVASTTAVKQIVAALSRHE